MAGLVLIGIPVGCGFIGAPILQFCMRNAGLDINGRLVVEGSLVLGGALGIWAFPPGSAKDGMNWGKFMICLTSIALGVFAFLDGGIINVFNAIMK